MTADFHRRVREIFDRAFEFPEAERMRFAAAMCGADTDLLQEVERLIRAGGSSGEFMATASSPIRKIGRYLIQGELGRGGMGIVYSATDPVIARSVALKVIDLKAIQALDEAEFMRESLFREARSCGRLSHPGIVTIFDVGQQDNSAFIAMERVDGQSLQRILATGRRLPSAEVLRILRETADALDYAHKNSVVHRDIKPGNIMIRNDGVVKVADFGIAKVISGSHTTLTGVVIGTPSYMSPEQIEGHAVDGRSDQFSLAVLAYELFAGARPFLADSIPTMAHLIVYGERPSPRVVDPTLPAAVDWVFRRAFARAAADRFPTCSEFIGRLQLALENVPAAAEAIPVQLESASTGSRGGGKSLLVASILAIILAASALVYFFRADLQSITPPWNSPGRSTPDPAAAKLTEPNNGRATTPVIAPPTTTDPALAANPPAIRRFRVEPTSIKLGDPASLTWEVTGASTVVIDHGIGKVPANDNSLIAPTVSTTYGLLATNSAGTTRRTTFVDVQPESIPPAVHARQLLQDASEERKAGHQEEANTLLTQAADLGNINAMLELGEIYRSGDGAEEDDTKALSWFHRAADSGNTAGMVSLGVIYLLGINGGDPNEAEATQWFQKAADRGDAAGLYNLAMSYEKGRGVPRNLDKARVLYERSAQTGNEEAQKRLRQLHMSK